MYFVIFPEGTRYSIKRKSVLEKSQEFTKDNNLAPLQQVIHEILYLCRYRHTCHTKKSFCLSIYYTMGDFFPYFYMVWKIKKMKYFLKKVGERITKQR